MFPEPRLDSDGVRELNRAHPVDPRTLRLHPLSATVPEMRPAEWQAFLGDVAEHGIHEPLRMAADGVTVLDGRHRLRAALELHLDRVEVGRAPCPPGGEDAYMLRAALNRRHLTEDQRSVLAARLSETLSIDRRRIRAVTAARARWDGGASGAGASGITGGPLAPPEERSRTVASRQLGVSERKLRGAQRLAVDHPDMAEKVLAGKLKLASALYLAQRKDALSHLVPVEGPFPAIRGGDFREALADLEPGSVSLILTDPPYTEAAVPLWNDLAELAQRLLKPGGVLVAWAGLLYFDRYMIALAGRLAWWTLAKYDFGPDHRTIQSRGIRTGFRPVLIFRQPPLTRLPTFYDGLPPGPNDKRFHDWGQPIAPAMRLVRDFSEEGELVLDPFCGAGTFVAASLRLGRRALGVELDPEMAEIARARVAGDMTGDA